MGISGGKPPEPKKAPPAPSLDKAAEDEVETARVLKRQGFLANIIAGRRSALGGNQARPGASAILGQSGSGFG